MSSDPLFSVLETWVAQGGLRPLDLAFAGFLKEQQPDAADLVLLAAVLVSHQLGRGHVCLDLNAAVDQFRGGVALLHDGEPGEQLPGLPAGLREGVTAEAWARCLGESDLVSSGDGNTPLVLSGGKLYLRRYWRYSRQVADGVRRRLAHTFAVPGDLPGRLDRLFAPLRTPGEQLKTEIHWQSVAAAIAVKSAFSVISGGPGTGKTTTVVHLLGLLQELALEQGHRLRIRLAAPTGKAAARLTESMGAAMGALPEAMRTHVPAEVTTLHRLLGSRPDTRRFVHHARNRLHVDLLVVDEASMIDLEMMAAVLDALPATARLVLLGDKDQLASVEAGSVLGDLCRTADPAGYGVETCEWIETYAGYHLQPCDGEVRALDQHIVVLQKSHRFGDTSGIGALARAVNAGDPQGVSAVWGRGFADIARLVLSAEDDAHFARLVLDGACDHAGGVGCPDASMGYRSYLECIAAGASHSGHEDQWFRAVLDAFNGFQLLAALRKGCWGVEGLNQRVARILFNTGLIAATEGWYVGRPVMVTRNDYTLGLMNGDTGIALPTADENALGGITLNVVFPMADGSLKKVRPSRLRDIETVYAMTVHKSQGSEFMHTALVLPDSSSPILTRELIYTAVTRSRKRFTLVSRYPDLPAEAVRRRIRA
jgi:exodeoxyribonuclease V alpha subunit